MAVDGFDRDAGNWPKCGKHGVSRAEIEDLLKGEHTILPDPAHSRHEERMLAIGRTAAGRALIVAFTVRWPGGKELVRPVSARYMHRREVARYEQ